MSVILDNGNRNDHAICIAGISRHQGYWAHSPTMPRGAPQGVQRHIPGFGASRWARAPLQEQFTGHTAVFTRVGGKVEFARGFVPNVSGYIFAFFSAAGGGGHWQNDIAMMADPTCISFEIPVTRAEAEGFVRYFNNAGTAINVYSLKGGNAKSTFNCVLAAVTVLANYLIEIGGADGAHADSVAKLMKVQDSSQGHMMRDLMEGFQ